MVLLVTDYGKMKVIFLERSQMSHVEKWIQRPDCEVNFHLIKNLTRHNGYTKHLHRFNYKSEALDHFNCTVATSRGKLAQIAGEVTRAER